MYLFNKRQFTVVVATFFTAPLHVLRLHFSENMVKVIIITFYVFSTLYQEKQKESVDKKKEKRARAFIAPVESEPKAKKQKTSGNKELYLY